MNTPSIDSAFVFLSDVADFFLLRREQAATTPVLPRRRSWDTMLMNWTVDNVRVVEVTSRVLQSIEGVGFEGNSAP